MKRKFLGAAMVVVALAAVSLAPTVDSENWTHHYGGRYCDYKGVSQLDFPAYAALSYTSIDTPSCSNIYILLYAEAVDCNQWYVQSHYSDWVVSDTYIDKRFFAMTTICNESGLEHKISISGTDVSLNLTTDAY